MLPVPNVPHCKRFKFGAFVHELKVVSGIRYPDYPPKNRGIRHSLVMTSEYTKMAVRYNMHMDTKVIEVADFKSEVKLDLRPFGGQLARWHRITRSFSFSK